MKLKRDPNTGKITGSHLDGARELIVRLYRQGWTLRQIGEELFTSSASIGQALKRYKEPARPRGPNRTKCVDCGKPTTFRNRCQLHESVRRAGWCRRWRVQQKSRGAI